MARLRRPAATLALVFAAVASLATSPAPPSVTGKARVTFDLSPESPVGARRITVSVDNGPHVPETVDLSVWPQYRTPDAIDYFATLLPEAEDEEPSTQSGPEVRHNLLPECARTCERSYLVVARLADPGSSVRVEIDANAAARYSFDATNPPQANAGVFVAEGNPLVPQPSWIRRELVVRLHVDDGSPSASWTGQLRIPSQVLDTPRGRLGGNVWVVAKGTGSAEAELFVGPSNPGMLFLPGLQLAGLDGYDWLEACRSKGESPCWVDLSLRLKRVARQTGELTVEAKFDARLEYFDLTAVPPEAELELISD